MLFLKKQNNILLLFLIVMFASCIHTDETVIKKMNIVLPKNYEGFVVIFYQQKINKGKMEFKNGEHFFYIPNDGVIFTTCKLDKIVEHRFLDSSFKKIKYKNYNELEDNEECNGCLWFRGSTEDSLGNIFVATFGKMGLKRNIKNMIQPNLQDIYYGRKTGEIKYWVEQR